MSSAKLLWFSANLSVFIAACGGSQTPTGDPNQRANPSDSPVIVLGRPTPQSKDDSLQVAEDEPKLPIVSANKGSKLTDSEISTLVRDPRREHWSPRATQLVVTELQGLEALFANMPANAPDKPLLMRRLASDYIELKFAARRDKQHVLDTGARPRPNEPERLDKTAKAAQIMAVKYFVMLTNQHPNFCQSPHPSDPNKNTGCVDDALYFLGLEHLELDAPDQARKSFLKLIQSFPMSPWVPYAYMAFGELFLAEGMSDPSKLDFARLSYEQSLKYPPSQNETYGFASYRLGQVERLKTEEAKALSHFTHAIEFTINNAALRPSGALGDAARREIAVCYAAVGEPRKAEGFFKRIAHDPPGSTERLVVMLDMLVSQYLRDNKRVEASDVCFSFSGGGTAIPSCRSIPAFQAAP